MKSEFSDRKSSALTDEVLDGGLAQLCRTLLSERSRLVEAVSTERNLRRGQLAAVARRLRQLQIRLRHEQTNLRNELLHKDILLRMERDKIAELEKTTIYCKICRMQLTENEVEELGYNTKDIDDRNITKNKEELCHLRARSIEELLRDSFTTKRLLKDSFEETLINETPKHQLEVPKENFKPTHNSTLQKHDHRDIYSSKVVNGLNKMEYMDKKSIQNILKESPTYLKKKDIQNKIKESTINSTRSSSAEELSLSQCKTIETSRIKQIEELLQKKSDKVIGEKLNFSRTNSVTQLVKSLESLHQNTKYPPASIRKEEIFKQENSFVKKTEDTLEVKSISGLQKHKPFLKKTVQFEQNFQFQKPMEKSKTEEDIVNSKKDINQFNNKPGKRTKILTEQKINSSNLNEPKPLEHSPKPFERTKILEDEEVCGTKSLEKKVHFQEVQEIPKPTEKSKVMKEQIKSEVIQKNSSCGQSPNRSSLPEAFLFSSIQNVYCKQNDFGAENSVQHKGILSSNRSSISETVHTGSGQDYYCAEPNLVHQQNGVEVVGTERVEIKLVHDLNGKEPNLVDEQILVVSQIKGITNQSEVFDNSDQQLSPSRLKISETITTEFEEEGEGWYAASGGGSDAEEDSSRHNMYRNNPVLECCNQILLRNVRDGAASPVPKAPSVSIPPPAQISPKNDNQPLTPAYMEPRPPVSEQYYETPIHLGNVYESLHSSSTHYEQIQHGSERTYQSLPATPGRRSDYVEMEVRRIPPAVPPKPVGGLPLQPTPQPASEPDYCSISELNLPSVEVTVPQKIVQVAGVAHIPRLPQVSEIIIPEENTSAKTPEAKKSPQSAPVTPDNYVRNNSTTRAARCIATARSVSSLLGAATRPALSPPQHLQSPQQSSLLIQTTQQQHTQHVQQHIQQPVQPTVPQRTLYHQPAFDLSQTFEEFKLDECELDEEEENVSEPPLESPKPPSPTPIYTLPPAYEHFLECTGLSNKSLLGSPRNKPYQAPHSPMRPKDDKLRSRLRMSMGTGPPTVKFQQ